MTRSRRLARCRTRSPREQGQSVHPRRDVELGYEVDLDAADLARPVGHAPHQLATTPAKVLEAQEDGLPDKGATGRMEGVDRASRRMDLRSAGELFVSSLPGVDLTLRNLYF